MLQTACAIASYPGGGHDRADVLRAGDDVCALVMADGMGGRSGAARAAKMWVEAVRVRAAQDQAQWAESDYWLDLMADADRAIRDDPEAGETTAVVAVMTPHGVAGASVADSGAWLIGADDYADLTRSQIRKPGLGTGMEMPIPFHRKNPPTGTLLVATDGLLKYASPQRICEKLRAHAAAIATLPNALIDLVRMPSGGLQDDVAVAVARRENS